MNNMTTNSFEMPSEVCCVATVAREALSLILLDAGWYMSLTSGSGSMWCTAGPGFASPEPVRVAIGRQD